MSIQESIPSQEDFEKKKSELIDLYVKNVPFDEMPDVVIFRYFGVPFDLTEEVYKLKFEKDYDFDDIANNIQSRFSRKVNGKSGTVAIYVSGGGRSYCSKNCHDQDPYSGGCGKLQEHEIDDPVVQSLFQFCRFCGMKLF